MTAVATTMPAGGDRREIRRLARRNAMLAAAMEIVTREGFRGLTMQGVSDRVGCSVGTVYTHFASKGVLVADLQEAAVMRIAEAMTTVRERSSALLDAAGADDRRRAAVGLLLFGELFIWCWDAFPEESHLLFSLLAERDPQVPADELDRTLFPILVLLAAGQDLLRTAEDAAVIEQGSTMDRVIAGAATLLGVLLTSHLGHIDAEDFDHRRLARTVWRDLTRGWGMSEDDRDAAEADLDELASTGVLGPAADRSGHPGGAPAAGPLTSRS